MMTVLIFLMIFVGVTAAWYQIYQMHFNINTLNEARLPRRTAEQLTALTTALETPADEAGTSRFEGVATRIFGRELNRNALRMAFSAEGRMVYGVPLLRRQRGLTPMPSQRAEGGRVGIRHLPLFRRGLPRVNVRNAFILLVIANCGLVQLLAAMSVYTIHYEVGLAGWAWVNQPTMILLVIWGVVVANALIFKLDAYTHDLYQLRELNRVAPLFD